MEILDNNVGLLPTPGQSAERKDLKQEFMKLNKGETH